MTKWAVCAAVTQEMLNDLVLFAVGAGVPLEPVETDVALPAMGDVRLKVALTITGGTFDLRADDGGRVRVVVTASGSVSFTGTGYSPGRTVAVLTSPGVGSVMVPSGPCAGGHTGLSAPTLRRTFAADAMGGFSVSASLPPALSGQYVVVFDMNTCTASPPALIP